jgi:hypothetical protein
MTTIPRRPRLALPFTIVTGPDTVRLVAGEDFRYTLTGAGLDRWLPGWLDGLDGRTPLDEVLNRLPADYRPPARQLVERLSGERVLIDGTAADAHRPSPWRLVPTGSAGWAAQWQPASETNAPALPALCQDRLDYDEAVRSNREYRETGTPWLWASTGAMGRAYISPLFLPDAALAAHAREGRPITPTPFPAPAVAIVHQLLLWKAVLAAEPEAHAALYRLHVLEVATLEISSHRLLVDPECIECGRPS